MPLKLIRKHKKVFFVMADVLIIAFSAWVAFLIRFEGQIPAEHLGHLYSLIALALIFSLPMFWWQGLYRFSWAYVGIRELYKIIKAVTLSSLFIAAALFILRDLKPFLGFPRSIIFINYFITFLSICGLRVGKRIFSESIKRPDKNGKKVLIVGAGEAGEELCRSLLKTKGYRLVGFVDDAESKQNSTIHGYPILGKRENIPEIVKQYEIEEIIIALPSVGTKIIKETVEICRRAKINKIKILPSRQEIIEGKVSLSNIRDITIEDLLGRDTISIDTTTIENFIAGKRVLVTGAAGSIGSHLCRQILKFKPAQLIGFDQNETGIFHLERELGADFFINGDSPHSRTVPFTPIIGDICDEDKVEQIFEKYKPNIVFHAAAYKHVPVMEVYPDEAVKNNIFGTLAVAQAAVKHGAENFVFISTDKAVNPTSVMGATKQVGEMICQWLNNQQEGSSSGVNGDSPHAGTVPFSSTKFCAVRFGNVLDSQGNVVGIFEEQIKKGGPVEVTDPEMKRYFMVTSEACLLVMQAGAISKGGEVFVLDMGKPIKIVDLAREMIKLAGYRPDIDIPIVSETTGSSTNVSAGSINSWKDFSGTVTNIVQVSNSSATEGGEDEEELEDFLERIAQWNMVQVPSLTSFIEQVVYTAGAIDVYIKWVGQPEYYRGYGMDVWVILPDIYVEASANSYEEIYEPVLPITQDPADNIYSGSIWQHTLNPGSYPYTYKYHPLVRQVQSALWEKGIWYIGSEDTIMVRLGRKVELDIDLYIRYNTSVNVSEVQSNVEDAVNNFFSEKGLGDRIDISDLIVVIGEVDGVDYIDTSQTSITDITRGKTYTPGEDAYITIDYWEYAKLGTLTINEV